HRHLHRPRPCRDARTPRLRLQDPPTRRRPRPRGGTPRMHQDHKGLTHLTCGAIAAGVASGRLSAEAVAAAFLDRAAAVDPDLGSYVALDAEGALAAARALPARIAAGEALPLAGVPVTVKDQFFTRGLRTTGGSRVFAGFVPDSDSPAVARLRRAGAIILGK